jgi:exonuclease VII small subunit
MTKSQQKESGQQINLTDTLKKLQEIVDWFEAQPQVDIEVGLEKAKEGVLLIKFGKERLKGLENEFTEIKKKLAQDEAD